MKNKPNINLEMNLKEKKHILKIWLKHFYSLAKVQNIIIYNQWINQKIIFLFHTWYSSGNVSLEYFK